MGYEQWTSAEDGSAFSPTGKTCSALPPGIYDPTVFNGQLFMMPVTARDEEIIRFPDTPTDEVVGEIQSFWSKQDAFAAHGLPFKRGILLYGPPGSGKTSCLQLVVRDVVKRGGLVFMFGGSNVFMSAYRTLRTIQPETPLVVLMEDLDEILGRTANESQILNLLDGVESTHKVVFLATTNYPEKLGARIVNRPSRFDRRFLVAHPSSAARRMYLETLTREGDGVDLERYVADSNGFSLAHLKELFVATVLLGTDYDDTVTYLKSMREKTAGSWEGGDERKVGFGTGGWL